MIEGRRLGSYAVYNSFTLFKTGTIIAISMPYLWDIDTLLLVYYWIIQGSFIAEPYESRGQIT
ncbi:hypothetical protein [Fluviicola sp.]|uniref:hypothetical protein n=1 Tax=Fluviicola sp. TaxID=1917219 RepID=UPI00262B4355|nr:hypothetical protein [Fluviicola sp.]